MKFWIHSMMAALIFAVLATPQFVHALENEETEETSLESAQEPPNWKEALQSHYQLSNEQIKMMEDKGLKPSQMARTAALSKKSGKPLDQIIQMRTGDKMGWGQIAKELGVPPSELGKSTAALKQEIQKEKKEDRQERKEARKKERQSERESYEAERKTEMEARAAEREARKAERKAKLEARKAERKAKLEARKAERDARKAERHAKKVERENRSKE